MSERLLDLVDMHPAAVAVDAPLREAAAALHTGVGAVAVLDGDKVVGMFTEDDLIRVLFPSYLTDVTHTAFVETDDERLGPHFDKLAETPVREVMREPEVVELPTSALDVAQRFLHSESSALIAVREGRFAGIIDQTAFSKALLGEYGWGL